MIENVVNEKEEMISIFQYLLKQNLITEPEYKMSIEKINKYKTDMCERT